MTICSMNILPLHLNHEEKNLRTLNVFPEHVHKMNSFEKCYHGKVIILVLNFLYKFFMFYL